MAAFGTSGIALLAVAGLVVVAHQSKVVPYAVEINDHGEVVKVRAAEVLDQPTANQIRASLRSWVMGARSVYSDGIAMRQALDETYAMTFPNSPAFKQLAAYHADHNPYARNDTVTVDVRSIVPATASTWQIEWTETTRDTAGEVSGITQWQGNFSIEISPPMDVKQVMANPLGMYVKNFAWTQRITG